MDGEEICNAVQFAGSLNFSQEVPLDSIECVLLTTEIYDRINFPETADVEAEEDAESQTHNE